MATYIKIIGNKDKLISEFIENKKKHWFFTTDRFTGIKTIQYKTDDELKSCIKELLNYFQYHQIEFKQTGDSINVKSEYLEIHYSNPTN